MLKMRTSIALAALLGATVAWVQVATAQSGGAAGGGSLSDSPYKSGAPPITGGYTDTSQGGTKTSGDPQAAPPSAKGQDQAAKGAQPQKAPDATKPADSAKDAKAPGSGG